MNSGRLDLMVAGPAGKGHQLRRRHEVQTLEDMTG